MRWMSFTVVALLGCTSSGPEPVSSRPADAKEARAIESTSAKTEAPGPDPGPTCEQKIAAYLEERAKLNHCEGQNDCAEIWPGVCPHGPFYIHRESDLGPVRALAEDIEAHCDIPECEPPMDLGLVNCNSGTCVAGPSPPPSDDESCWEIREEYLEPRAQEGGFGVSSPYHSTERFVVAVAKEGTLRLTVEWPRDCLECRLDVSEHSRNMDKLVDTKPSASEDAERDGRPIRRDSIELTVTPGPYYIMARSAESAEYRLRSELSPPEVTMHGIGWPRICSAER